MYYCYGISDKGIMPHNEDALMMSDFVLTHGSGECSIKPPFILAVADGVSGECAGELASAMCLGMVKEINDFRRDSLEDSIMTIHEKIAEFGRNDSGSRNMQTTLCGISVDTDGVITSFNAGDSRLYRFHDGFLEQITRDQSLVQLLYEEGKITPEERRTHARRNIIFPVIGNINDSPTVEIRDVPEIAENGDILMLCTDGLSDYLSDEEIKEILERSVSLHEKLDILMETALKNGSKDNISIILVSPEKCE
ncbi:MAG: SpoIIE family protein phosphatase [Ruminococcus sp.]|nr:SpoIIE family protein phosphatase [Ruminococcus sp.]